MNLDYNKEKSHDLRGEVCLSGAMPAKVFDCWTKLWGRLKKHEWSTHTFIAKVQDYQSDIANVIKKGFSELGVLPEEFKGKTILLKPNLVQSADGAVHINTHPLVVRGTVEAFLSLGADKIVVAEGPGHSRDSLHVLEECGMAEVLVEDRIPFIDLNFDDIYCLPNAGRWSGLKTLSLPVSIKKADWVVSMPKMKTHHWAGVTLSMKNLFGVMPGIVYGWPKNVLHLEGIEKSIFDINATLRTDFAIVDGIVGMAGDGPIMGSPHDAGVIVMGRNLPAVDSTCCRIMGIDPRKVRYLAKALKRLGPIDERNIYQSGETVESVRTDFELVDDIPAHMGIRI